MKLSLFVDGMIIHEDNPKDSAKKKQQQQQQKHLLELINEFSETTG